jgi:hypothetical protein
MAGAMLVLGIEISGDSLRSSLLRLDLRSQSAR